MTDPRLTHRAKIVSELTERLGNAFDGTDEDAGFLASQLEAEAKDLESLCLYALRQARVAEAYSLGLVQIIKDNRERKERMDRKAETIRESVSKAMAEAGLPKLTAPDMTVSNIPGKKLIVEGKPTKDDYEAGRARASFDWSKTAIRTELEAGTKLNFASLVDGFSLRINAK